MGLFDRFSDRAKTALFWALYTASIDDKADDITPEHILHALIHAEPDLFHVLAPQIPDLLDNLKKEYCDGVVNPFDRSKLRQLLFSVSSMEIIWAAKKYRARFRHQHVEVGHLLLAIVACKGPFTVWFTRRVRHSKAQESLLKLGVTTPGLEARIREAPEMVVSRP